MYAAAVCAEVGLPARRCEAQECMADMIASRNWTQRPSRSDCGLKVPSCPKKELAHAQVRDWLPRHLFPESDDPIPNLPSPRAKVQLMEYGLYYPCAIGAVGFAEEAVVLLLWARAGNSSIGFEGPAR